MSVVMYMHDVLLVTCSSFVAAPVLFTSASLVNRRRSVRTAV